MTLKQGRLQANNAGADATVVTSGASVKLKQRVGTRDVVVGKSELR